MNPKDLTPPAIVREGDSLEQLAFEITAAVEAGEKATRQGIARFIEAGELLNKAKARLSHGDWLPFLKKHVKRSRSEVSRWMRIAREKANVARMQHLNDALRMFVEDAPEEEQPSSEPPVASDPPAAPTQSRAERLNIAPPKPFRVPDRAPVDGHRPDATQSQVRSADGDETTPVTDAVDQSVPPDLAPVFEKANEFHEIINLLNAINRKLQALQEHPAGACMRLQAAQIDLTNLKETVHFGAPYAVCPVCIGNVATRKANCPCKQRGWLIEAAYKNLPQEFRK